MRPNILFICTDQQRFNTLRSAGNSEIETPHLDQLAARGVRFDHCYVQSPVCAPSRASLMTGQYVHSHGLWANGVALPPGRRLFSRDLADAGYDCGLVGKFHLAACFGGRLEPRHDDGFRVFRWAHDPYPGSSENHYHRWLKATHPELYAQAIAEGNDSFDRLPTQAHYSHWIADETIDFLTSSRDRDKPFFFVANFFDPHHGFGAPPEYADRYRPEAISRPITRDGELDDKPEIQREASRETYAGHLPGFTSCSPDEIQQIRADYYAMVTLVDDEVGRIIAALDEQGLRESTLVVFTSDHGEMLGDHQLLLKGPMLYDEAVRVPLLMSWPGILPEGRVVDDLVQWIDLPTTLLAVAGVTSGQFCGQGDDLWPLAVGDAQAQSRGWALSEYRNSGHPYDDPAHLTMLRTPRWKLVLSHGPPAAERARDGELYDLDADPHELTNLWHDPAHLQMRLELTEQLLDVLVATEDRSQPRDAFW